MERSCARIEIKDRWRTYFNHLLNNKNLMRELEQMERVGGPVRRVTGEVTLQLEKNEKQSNWTG